MGQLEQALAHLQSAQVEYKSCNKEVGEIMAEDTMQSVKHLLPDILNRLPVLLYQVGLQAFRCGTRAGVARFGKWGLCSHQSQVIGPSFPIPFDSVDLHQLLAMTAQHATPRLHPVQRSAVAVMPAAVEPAQALLTLWHSLQLITYVGPV